MFSTGPRILFLRGSVVSHAAEVRAQLAQAPDPGRIHAILRTLHRSHEKAAFLRFSGGTNRRLRVRSAGISVSMDDRARQKGQAKRAGAETISKQNRGAQARQAGQATQQASGSGCSDGPVGAKIQGAKMILGAPLHYLPAKTETGTRKKTRKGQESQALENPHMSKFKSRKTGTWSRVALHPVAAFACSA